MTTITNNKLPEWRTALDKCVENYQSTRAWYEENPDNPAAEQDMDAAKGDIEKLLKQYGVLIVLSLMDEIDELQELRRSCLALRGEIEDVQAQLYEAENRNNADDEELQERRKADSEPAGYHVIKECGKVGCSVATLEEAEKTRDFWNKKWIIRPYFYTPPASERERIRREHAEWSDATFGDVGPVGPLKHLSKEAMEAAADPSDPLEWADMQFLLWDAQRRMGLSDEFITRAMIEKLAINKARQWPEPKDGEPRLHIKAQPAPVVPEEMPKGLAGQIVSLLAHNIGDKFLAQKIWNACRAALLQSKYRDLSQPVDPQISEYEKIMLRAGMRQEPVAFLNYSGTIMTVGSYGFNLEPGKLLPLYAAPYFKTARESGSQQNARENKSVNYPAHIASKLERLGGMFSLELLLTDFADELVKDGNKFEASILRNAAECINKINQEGRNDNKQNTE